MRLILTVAVLVLDLWAIVSILGATAPARSRAGWILAVVALPVVGFIAWWRSGPKALSRQ